MLKKTALSYAASPFTTVPQRDSHQPPSSHSPRPGSPCQPLLPSNPDPLKLISELFSPHSQPHPQHNPSFPR
ncbi:hypothetical protein DNK68_19315 [Klebsiella pneumoniae]|nr:hypothetical protein DNK68_19315 [Klebsiella pneumoniae]